MCQLTQSLAWILSDVLVFLNNVFDKETRIMSVELEKMQWWFFAQLKSLTCLSTRYAYVSFRFKILEVATDVLIKEEILSENDQLSSQVVVHLLPFMVIDNDDMESAEMKMAVYLSKSGICSLHPILRGWKEGKKFSWFLEKVNRWHCRIKYLQLKIVCYLKLLLHARKIYLKFLLRWKIYDEKEADPLVNSEFHERKNK